MLRMAVLIPPFSVPQTFRLVAVDAVIQRHCLKKKELYAEFIIFNK